MLRLILALLVALLATPAIAQEAPQATDVTSADIQTFIDYFDPVIIDEYDRLLSYNGIFISRTANVGILPASVSGYTW